MSGRPPPSILRIALLAPSGGGVGGGDAAALRFALADRFRGRPSSSSSDADADADDGPPRLLSISNRYFDADVLLLGLDESADGEGLEEGTEDGLVLAFDASLPSSSPEASFDALSSLHERALRLGRCGDLLRLCVGVRNAGTKFESPSPLADGSKRSEDEYARRVLWCLDRGYEYVEADLSEEGMTRGHDERDKEGFARVVEAVGTCMWSSHVMKPRGGTARAVGASRGSVGATGGTSNGSSSATGATKADEDATSSEPRSDGSRDAKSPRVADSEREKAAMASLLKDADVGDGNPEDDDGKPHNDHQEVSFHQLESALSEAKLIREASRNGSLSDQERRERAGAAAERIMGLLDGMGSDDEDEGGSSGEDEGEG